ncbi:MAG: pyridoxal-phosphate dependent enzyme [Candidatus Lokiarchaeota archaeon]|nr:pyridoxal-phosphate dependent enzyme [Candidatus Lokiarchaeota archaeon]
MFILMLSVEDILAAHKRIEQYIVKTPIMTSNTLDSLTRCKVYLKCENFQRVGAFKFRGALNALSLLSSEEKEVGVVAHSSGNHAQAVSLAAKMLNIEATIVMPSDSSPVKIQATKGYGAKVILCKPTLESRIATTEELIEEYGYTLIHPYNDLRVIAGAGTAALEFISEVGCIDIMMTPVGGGGLLSGTSIVTKSKCPDARIIAGEPENADDAYKSFKAKKFIPSVNPNTFADGLRTSLGENTFEIILNFVDDIITVSEKEILEAMRFLWERMKLVVEPSGAVPIAALVKQKKQLDGQKIGVIISGGNVDLSDYFINFEHKIGGGSGINL